MSNKEVTHKELLVFSNLTRLEWEHVNLEAIEDGDLEVFGEFESEDEISTQLNDLLTPEVFVREYDNGSKENRYGADENGELISQEKGLIEMRQEAGIAMEYLEKSDEGQEGEFINDWEVIYAADNYKLVKDYLTSLQKLEEESGDIKGEENQVKEPSGFMDNTREKVANSIESTFGSNAVSKFIDPERSVLFEGDIPTRDELEDAEDFKGNVKVIFSLVEGALTIGLDCIGIGKSKETNLIADISKNVTKSFIKSGSEVMDSLPLQILGLTAVNSGELDVKTVTTIVRDISNPVSKDVEERLDFNIKDFIEDVRGLEEEEIERRADYQEIKQKVEEVLEEYEDLLGLEIHQELSMFDTGFRVLVLKKDDEIVISYEGERPDDNRALPKEFDHLQVLYGLLKYRGEIDSDTQITFTGYEGGGDLGFLNSLFVDEKDFKAANFFSHNLKQVNEYINFTKNHIDKDYQTNIEILFDNSKDLTIAAAKRAFFAISAAKLKFGAGIVAIKATLIAMVIWQGVNFAKDILRSSQIRRVYEKFIEFNYITEGEGVIQSSEQQDVNQSKLKHNIPIEGYITEDFLETEYIILESVQGEEIKIKKEDGIYLIAEELDGDIKRDEDLKERLLVKKEFFSTPDGTTDRYYWVLENDNDLYEITKIKVRSIGPMRNDVRVSNLTEGDKEELQEGYALTSLMELMGEMQRNYINRNELTEVIYYDKRDLFSKEGGTVEIRTDILQLEQEIKEADKEVDSDFLDYLESIPETGNLSENIRGLIKGARNLWDFVNDSETRINEFVFMPYIEEDGNIDRQEPKLRDDYLASIFKSMLQYSYESDNEKSYSQKEIKYGGQKPSIDYTDNFRNFIGEADLNEELLEILSEVSCHKFINVPNQSFDDLIVLFNHYQAFLEKVKEDNEILEKYYKVIAEGDEEWFGNGFFTGLEGEIIINPNVLKQSAMEYKYNPYDAIVGGELEIYAENIPEDAIEEDVGIDYPAELIAAVTLGNLNIKVTKAEELVSGLEKVGELTGRSCPKKGSDLEELTKLTKPHTDADRKDINKVCEKLIKGEINLWG